MELQPKVEEKQAQPYMGVRQITTMAEMDRIIPEAHDAVYAWLGENGIEPTGAPFVRYHVIDMADEMDIEMGVPVTETKTGNDYVKAGELPAGRYAALVYQGLMNGIESNGVLIDWARAQGIEWDQFDSDRGDGFVSRYEAFLTEPDDEPDVSKWLVEVAIKVKDSSAS